ncbi:hypothetical protein PoB_005236900 [Plakobranchus ocellatus]|uniref:Uncharacterized protein n=1 Tax=Plakobranchus ocellatus TaxID=259542 RepID=A0AAV4C028_9GAST|nr:hypothetical protein PoB_005236900 [Plakobranchus ocellatus]
MSPLLVPPTVPSDVSRNTRLGSIVKRSTQSKLLVPPTIHSNHGAPALQMSDASQPGSNDIQRNIIVPPTISPRATPVSTSQSTTQAARQTPGVLCYADQPVDHDIPCPGNSSVTVLSEQHMEALLKNQGGTLIQDVVSIKASHDFDMNGNSNHVTSSPTALEEQDKFNNLILTISLRLNQQMLSLLNAETSFNIKAKTHEVIILTGVVYDYVISTYGENVIFSLFTNRTELKAMEDITYKNFSFLNVFKSNTNEDFPTQVLTYLKTTERIQNFYLHLLNTNKNMSKAKETIIEFEKDVDFHASQVLYANIDSAISRLESTFSEIRQNLQNISQLASPLSNETMERLDNEKQSRLITAMRSYVRLGSHYADILENTTDRSSEDSILNSRAQPEDLVHQVMTLVESNLQVMAKFLKDCSIIVGETQKNIEKIKNLDQPSKRKRRDVIGTSSVTCQKQGERINHGNYLSLCSSCIQTTMLNEDYFPRYITEKVCQPAKTTTFSGNQIPQQGCLYQPGSGES